MASLVRPTHLLFLHLLLNPPPPSLSMPLEQLPNIHRKKQLRAAHCLSGGQPDQAAGKQKQ